MKKIITALGFVLVLVSTGASAHHMNLSPNQSGSSSSGTTVTGGTVSTPFNVSVLRSRRRDILTDPRSCVEKWGTECVPAVVEPAKLDLGDTDLSKHDTRTKTPEMVAYDVFSIIVPSEDSAIRSNTGNFSVEFEVKPGLAMGHSIEVFMDGQSTKLKEGRSQQSEVRLTNVDRGTHQIYGVIVDGSNVELARSKTVTLHLQRVSVGSRPASP